MDTNEIERRLIEYIDINGGIDTPFGKAILKRGDRIGQGGNGLVYLAYIESKEIAIKFLICDSNNKLMRFKSEFFNINYVRDKLSNIVNMIYYGEIILHADIIIPYIVMSTYSKNLKKYRYDLIEIDEEEFKRLFGFLVKTLGLIHKNGIVHRDLKPENILVDSKNNFVIADFGIAHFDKERFPIDNKTKKGERLANVEFSAPEQINYQYEVGQTADIYSMAQILYWYTFGKVNRGTGAEQISDNHSWKDAQIYDRIIDKCLRNNPNERFQSMREIMDYYEKEKAKKKKINPFDDMYEFSKSVLSVVPEFYGKVYSVSDKNIICELLSNIFNGKYNMNLEYNTGMTNNSISSFEVLENGDFLIGNRQVNVSKVWGIMSSSIYDDIILLELGKSSPYIIDGEVHYDVAVINGDSVVPYGEILSGYVRHDGKVYDVSSLEVQNRFIEYEYRIMAIGVFHSCVVIEKNDEYLRKLQTIESLQASDIYELREKIRMNRTIDVNMWL